MEPLLPDHYYHIYNHANGEDVLFRNSMNYDFFLEKYVKFVSVVAYTYVYCLMPNHFHFMVRLKNKNEIIRTMSGKLARKYFDSNGDSKLISLYLSKQFAKFFSSYTQSFNKIHDRMGSLFVKNFKRKPADDEDYRRELVVYIHQNPVLHGFVEYPDEWDYSSFNDILFTNTTFLLRDEVIRLFGDLDNLKYCHNK